MALKQVNSLSLVARIANLAEYSAKLGIMKKCLYFIYYKDNALGGSSAQ